MAERRNPNSKANSQLFDLPSDLLIRILTKLDNSELKPLTLVSESFRSLTDQLVHKLTFNIYNPVRIHRLPNALSRFTSVTQISIMFDKHIADALIAVSESPWKLEALDLRPCRNRASYPISRRMISLAGRFGTVKVLRLDRFECGKELQMIEFVHLFPDLEELGLSHCENWSDDGIEKLELASTVPNLRKINISCNCFLTDRALDVLSNCVNLEHLSSKGCHLMTYEGFCRFVRNRRNLTSIELMHHFSSAADWRALVQIISVCQNLSHLSISEIYMRDDFLLSVSKLRFPLTSLEFHHGVSENTPSYMTGLSAMLSAFRGLTELRIYLPRPRDDALDMKLSQLVKSLSCLKEFVLVTRRYGCATLFSLIHNCPLLERIFMNFLKEIPPFVVPQQIRKNYSIRSIILMPTPIPLKAVLEPICPSVKKWEIWD